MTVRTATLERRADTRPSDLKLDLKFDVGAPPVLYQPMRPPLRNPRLLRNQSFARAVFRAHTSWQEFPTLWSMQLDIMLYKDDGPSLHVEVGVEPTGRCR
jgi:hypothetical protein